MQRLQNAQGSRDSGQPLRMWTQDEIKPQIHWMYELNDTPSYPTTCTIQQHVTLASRSRYVSCWLHHLNHKRKPVLLKEKHKRGTLEYSTLLVANMQHF